MKTGWIEEPNEVYHLSEGVGSTGLKNILKSPAHYKCPDVGPSQEVCRIGSLIHTAILEPERYIKDKLLLPSGRRSLKAIKEKWRAFWGVCDQEGLLRMSLEDAVALRSGETNLAFLDHVCPIRWGEQEMIDAIQERIGQSQRISEMLAPIEGNAVETSGYNPLEWGEQKFTARIRPDLRIKSKNVLVDLKTTEDAGKFERDVFKNGYHLQAAWYLDNASIIDDQQYSEFFFIVIEKSPPYGVQIYSLTTDAYLYGKSEYERALDIYSACVKKGEWPAYSDRIREITLPNYLKGGTS